MKGYALITGAAGGIGRALVSTFHGAGYNVIGIDIRPEPEQLPFSTYIQADLKRFVDDEPYAQEIRGTIIDSLNGTGLHALINNAAVQILGGASSIGREEWRRTLDINLLAPFFLTQSLLAEMEKCRGCVINISSIHARLTKDNFVAYATSKAALSGMTRALAVDLGHRIRVNAIEPAAVETDMLKAGFIDRPENYRLLAQSHPQQRIGKPGEIARLALAVVEGGVDFLHGACIGLDGGISGRLHDS